MRNFRFLLLAALTLTACEIKEGDVDWDGSLFDDASLFRDSEADDDDGGTPPPKDAGKADAGKDAGKDASSGDSAVDSSLPPEDAGQALTPADVASVLAKGRCGALEACMGKELLLATFNGNDCVDFTTKQQADRDLHWLAGSVSRNSVTFRPEQLETCRKDLVKLGCDVTNRRLPESCERAVEGKSDIDDNCSIDQDCKGNAYCDKGSLETCPGQCAELQTSGLPCSSSLECNDGLVCRGGSCKVPLAEGDACTQRKGSECPPGLVCQGKSGMLTCQSIETLYAAKEGEACDLYGKLCQSGLVCQSQSASNTMGICAKPAAMNGTCRPAEPGQCPITQYCKDSRSNVTARAEPGKDGVCADLPRDGSTCIGTSTQAGEPLCPVGSLCCAPGAVCVGPMSAPVCHAMKMAGGACTTNAECYGGLCQADVCAITTIECK